MITASRTSAKRPRSPRRGSAPHRSCTLGPSRGPERRQGLTADRAQRAGRSFVVAVSSRGPSRVAAGTAPLHRRDHRQGAPSAERCGTRSRRSRSTRRSGRGRRPRASSLRRRRRLHSAPCTCRHGTRSPWRTRCSSCTPCCRHRCRMRTGRRSSASARRHRGRCTARTSRFHPCTLRSSRTSSRSWGRRIRWRRGRCTCPCKGPCRHTLRVARAGGP